MVAFVADVVQRGCTGRLRSMVCFAFLTSEHRIDALYHLSVEAVVDPVNCQGQACGDNSKSGRYIMSLFFTDHKLCISK